MPSDDLNGLLFNLKFTAKQFGRSSKRCEKQERLERARCRKSIQQQNVDCARIHAENAIRKHNEALDLLRLQSRIDAVASRVQSASQMRMIGRSLLQLTTRLEEVLKKMDPAAVSREMDRFERQFEDLDVTSSYIDEIIDRTTSLTTPQDEVTELMGVCADEMELNMRAQMGGVYLPSGGRAHLALAASREQADTDDLEARLAALKNM